MLSRKRGKHLINNPLDLFFIVQADDGLSQEVHRTQVSGARPPEGRGRLHRQEQLKYLPNQKFLFNTGTYRLLWYR